MAGSERHSHTSSYPVKVKGLDGEDELLIGVEAIAACGGQATTGHSLALLKDGTVAAWGDNEVGQLGNGTTTDRPAPFQSRAVSGVVSVAAGGYHSLAG